MEVFLYRCDRCGTVIAIENDRGSKFYVDKCEACKEWSDYDKIIMKIDIYQGSRFMVEEKKDDSKEKEQANEH